MPPSQGLLQWPTADPAHQVIYGGEYGPQPFYWSPFDGIIIRGARPPSGRGVLSSHRPAGLCAAAPDDDQQTAALPMTFHQHHPSDNVDMMVERSVMLPSFQGIEPSAPARTSSSLAAWPSDVLATSAAHQSAAPPAALPPSPHHHQSSPSGHLPCTLGFSSCANSGMMAPHVDSILLDIASMSLRADCQSAPCDDSATTPQQQQQQKQQDVGPSALPTTGSGSTSASMKDKPESTKTEKAIRKAADIKCHCCKKLFAPSTQKKYLCARRICSVCSQASRVLNNDGVWVRYCHLCRWTHPLENFKGELRSCKPLLKSHKKRRRDRDGACKN